MDVKVVGGEAAVVVLDLAALAVVGVGAQEGFGRVELLLEVAVGDHAEGVKVGEVEVGEIEVKKFNL